MSDIVAELKKEYYDLIAKYNKLPRRESFSGWGYLSEIEKTKEKLENLGIDIEDE
jgi:hypothetical protein